MKKSFKTKIPSKYWEEIFEWYTCGVNLIGIVEKLNKDYNTKVSPRTLARLIDYLKDEKQNIIQAVFTKKTQEQVSFNFDELATLYKETRELSKIAYNIDNNLYLRTIDRLTKLIQIQLSIETKDDNLNQDTHEAILLSLAGK